MKLTDHERNNLWDAITEYTEACGGNTGAETVSVRRMSAVVRIESIVEGIKGGGDRLHDQQANAEGGGT